MIHDNGRLIENPMEQKVLKQIFELKREGSVTRAISNEVSTPVMPISFKTVQRLLQRHAEHLYSLIHYSACTLSGPSGWQSLLPNRSRLLAECSDHSHYLSDYAIHWPRKQPVTLICLIDFGGVTLGVLILIVALAVINGSIETLRKEAPTTPHVTIAGPGLQANWRELRDVVLSSEKSLPRPRL